jgi:hypothetical protein
MHNEPGNLNFLKKEAEKRKDISDIKCAGLGAVVEGGWPASVILSMIDTPEVDLCFSLSLCYSNDCNFSDASENSQVAKGKRSCWSRGLGDQFNSHWI